MVVKSDFGRHSCDCAGKRKRFFFKHFCSRGRRPASFWLLLSLPSPKITCSGNFQFPAASETEYIEQICHLARTEGGPVIDLTISPRHIRGLCTKTVITTPLSLSSSYWKAQSFFFPRYYVLRGRFPFFFTV